MLSSSSKYAINAVLYIAVHASEEKKLRATEVAEAIKLPSPFLAKLLQNLSKAQLISSAKGPKGGFFLTKEAKESALIEIVKAIDGVQKIEDCVLGLKKCSSAHPCPIHFSIQPYKTKFLKELEENSIEQFAEKVKKGETFLFL